MLRHRVIPVVLLDGFSVVKTIQFNVRRNLGNPIAVARVYNTRNVDELILLDIDASKENRCIDLHTIEEVASECFMPLGVGGGIKTCADIENVLKKGADKVILNTIALIKPAIIHEFSRVFGSQCIMVSVDVKKNAGTYGIFSHSGLKVDKDVFEWCREVVSLGAGELMINSVDGDGKMVSYDYELIERVAYSVGVPVIACGGASKPGDFPEAVHRGASAVAAASIFHFTDYTPNDCKMAMKNEGIPIR